MSIHQIVLVIWKLLQDKFNFWLVWVKKFFVWPMSTRKKSVIPLQPSTNRWLFLTNFFFHQIQENFFFIPFLLQPNSQACQTFLIRRVDGGLNLSENLSSNSSFLSIVDKCSRTGELENDNCGTLTLKLRNNDDDKNHKQQNVYYDSSALTNFQMISSNKNDTLEGAENGW